MKRNVENNGRRCVKTSRGVLRCLASDRTYRNFARILKMSKSRRLVKRLIKCMPPPRHSTTGDAQGSTAKLRIIIYIRFVSEWKSAIISILPTSLRLAQKASLNLHGEKSEFVKTTGHFLKTTGHLLKTTDYLLKTTDYLLKTTDYLLKTTDYLLPPISYSVAHRTYLELKNISDDFGIIVPLFADNILALSKLVYESKHMVCHHRRRSHTTMQTIGI